MNQEDFTHDINEYIEECYQEFYEYQKITNDILDIFHELCVSNEIKYFLYFGTLLGAIRDSGNVPWDYDIDVVVPIDYQEKLIKALDTQLNDTYYYAYYNNIKDYPTSCLRVCKKGYPFTSLHVDVFFLVGCPDDIKETNRFVNKINKYSGYRVKKYGPRWFKGNNNEKNLFRKIIDSLVKLRAFFIPQSFCDKERNYMYKYPLQNSKNCFVAGDLMNPRVLKTEWFRDVMIVSFNGNKRFVPVGYEEILVDKFGDYSKYPTMPERFDEFYSSFRTVKYRIEEQV